MPCLPWKKSKVDAESSTPNKPSSSPFMQQQLPASTLDITASTMLPIFLCLAVAFVPIGIVFLTTNSKVLETVVEYTDCKQYTCDSSFNAISGSGVGGAATKKCCNVAFNLKEEYTGLVYMYYQLENFFQNHRAYARSKDDEQLYGVIKKTLSSNCKAPYRYRTIQTVNNHSQDLKIAPCGAIANSIFNDTFKLVYVQVGPDIPVTLSDENITWTLEKQHKFQNPSLTSIPNNTLKNAYKDFVSPPNWPKPIYELSPYDPDNNGNLNSDFIVWMRAATFPKFRKLFRQVVHVGAHFGKGLPKGNYRMDIQYNFPVADFKGKKYFVLTTIGWLGGKNNFLGVCYLATGIVCLIAGFISTVLHMKSRTKSPKVSSTDYAMELKRLPGMS